ncbi:MAG: hypothetical protein ACLVJ6_11975 [Merdibacter sp.]
MGNVLQRAKKLISNSSPPQLLSAGFAAVILIGALILMLPISVRDDATVSFIDALFTSTSAVCVTGLIAIDTADHFTGSTDRGRGADPDRRARRDMRRRTLILAAETYRLRPAADQGILNGTYGGSSSSSSRC